MHKVQDQIQDEIKAQFKRMAALTSVMLMAAAEALAQDTPSRPARRIVVSIADRKLAVLEGDRTLRIFETAVGAPKSPSPTGVYQIVNSIADPTWYTKGKIVPPGKCNPLGTRWLGLSRKGYGIHGTNRPDSIGHNASHGCIRMRNREVEELFKMVTVGDQVELLGERTPETARLFGERALGAAAAVTTAAVAAAGVANVAPAGVANVVPAGVANVAPAGVANVAPAGVANVVPAGVANVAPAGGANVAGVAGEAAGQ
jgi:hypothetical protein